MSKIKELLKQDKKLGREREKLDRVIARYPGGMTINGYDTDIGKNGEPFPVFTIKEDPTIYFGGGGDLKKLESRMLAIHGGDLTAINEELEMEPLRVKIEKVDTKNGNQYTTVKLLEDDYKELEMEPLRGKIKKVDTKNWNQYTTVNLLEADYKELI